MPVTRKRLETVIASLKDRESFRFDEETLNRSYDSLDVFPAVEGPFSPGTAGGAAEFLSWSAKDDEAFDEKGVLTHPLVMRWGGDWIDLQLTFLRQGNLVTRVESDPQPVRGFHQSGRLMLSPQSEELDTDLRRLLHAFTVLLADGVIALANPGWTQSQGWESVNERAGAQWKRTAVFWHSQSHDTAFDRCGRLIGPLFLHWGGELARIIEPLRAEGFTVEAPASEDTAIIIRSGPCGDPGLELPPAEPVTVTPLGGSIRGEGLTECLRFETDEPKPVASLAFSTHGPRRLVVELGSDRRGGPQKRPQVYELEKGQPIAELPARSPYGACGGLHFLPDGRLLYSLYDFGEGSQAMVSLRVWREGTADAPELAIYPNSHVGERCQTAVDSARQTIAVATRDGIVLRGIGGPDAPLPAPKAPTARMTIRRKNAAPPVMGPWDEVARLGESADAYPMLAMSPDAQHLLWTANGSTTAKLISRASNKVLWTTNFFEGHSDGRGTKGLRFSNSGEQVLVTVALSQAQPQPDGRVDSITLWKTQIHRTADGERKWPRMEELLAGAICLSFHPLRGELAAGFDDGRVRLFAFPSGEELASVTIDRPVHAVAFDAAGAQLAVGAAKGEVFIFVRE